MIPCGLLASGRLGLTILRQVFDETQLNFVLTDARSGGIREFCEKNQIPVFVGNPRKRDVRPFLERFRSDVILSINYLFIVGPEVLDHPSLLAINLHGSLLPKYRGRTPHVWAIINNETETGVTAHLMNEECDTGDIVLQRRIPISAINTGGEILNQYENVYPELVRELFRQIETESVSPRPQDHSKASFFGKRTPDDGQIIWNWQRERIYNWIRAQARPYPGAFFHFDGKRHCVHASRLSDTAFSCEMENGTVLSLDPLIVKTPNGAIELLDHSFRLPDPNLPAVSQMVLR